MKDIVLESHHTSLRDLTVKLNTPTAQHIVVDIFGVRRFANRLVPKDLTFVEKHHRKTVIEDLISAAKNPTFVKWIITGDET